MTILRRMAAPLLLLAGLGPAAPAGAETAVDLELVLAADASRSIDDYEFSLQRMGYAKALTHPDVLRAITGGYRRRIAVTYVEWSGAGEQATVIEWTVIGDRRSAEKFAASLIEAPRIFYDSTAVGSAIDYAARLFSGNGIAGARRVIDVSGDGPTNRGRPSWAARDDAVKAGITINGLAILNDRPSRPPWQTEEVDVHYREQVIGGPGAFMMTVDGFDAFAEGIRRKMILEIAGTSGRSAGTASTQGAGPRRSIQSTVRTSHSSGKTRVSSAFLR